MSYWKKLFEEIAEENECSFDEAVEIFEEQMEFQRELAKEEAALKEVKEDE